MTASPVILIVEDDAPLRELTAQFLRSDDFIVLEAATAQDAVNVIENGAALDLVLSDINMPGSMNGEDLAVWLSVRHPRVPIILTSGAVSIDLELESATLGFLAKPYDLDELEQKIQALLDGAPS